MGLCQSKYKRNSRELARDMLPVVSDMDVSKHGRILNKNEEIVIERIEPINESTNNCDCCAKKTYL